MELKRFLNIAILSGAFVIGRARAFNSTQISAGAGMTMTSYSEGTGETQASGSSSTIGLNVGYEYFPGTGYSFVVGGSIPILGVSETSILMIGGAMNFYFMGLGTSGSFFGEDGAISFNPGMRLFAGPTINVGYLVYQTETAKKSDVLFDVGAHAGVVYNLSQSYGVKAYAAFGRGVGVVTSSINMRFGAEGVYIF